jgi:hypothetical protein
MTSAWTALGTGLAGFAVGGGWVALFTNWDRTRREKNLGARTVVADYVDAVSDVMDFVYNLPVEAATGLPGTTAPAQPIAPIREAYRVSSRAQTRFDLLITNEKLRAQARLVDEAESDLMTWVAQYDAAMDPNPRRISTTATINLNSARDTMNDRIDRFQEIARDELPK